MKLTTYTNIFQQVLDERSYFDSDEERAIHEMAESLCPVYYGEIVAEWADLSHDDSDRWLEMGLGAEETIYTRMSIDLFLYYEGLVSRAWAEVQETHTCETEAPASVTVSPSGAIATCSNCSFKSGLWECACELVHECEAN